MEKTKIEHKKSAPKEKEAAPAKRPERYVAAIGRRKTAVASVRITSGHGKFIVNDKPLKEYFKMPRVAFSATVPLEKLKLLDQYDMSAKASGSGLKAQAGAVRLGLSRALAEKNPDFKKRLRKLGFLTRDARKVERKKYGLKKARRAPQWAKR